MLLEWCLLRVERDWWNKVVFGRHQQAKRAGHVRGGGNGIVIMQQSQIRNVDSLSVVEELFKIRGRWAEEIGRQRGGSDLKCATSVVGHWKKGLDY